MPNSSVRKCKCHHQVFQVEWSDGSGYVACPIGGPHYGGCGFFEWMNYEE